MASEVCTINHLRYTLACQGFYHPMDFSVRVYKCWRFEYKCLKEVSPFYELFFVYF